MMIPGDGTKKKQPRSKWQAERDLKTVREERINEILDEYNCLNFLADKLPDEMATGAQEKISSLTNEFMQLTGEMRNEQ